MKLKKFLLHFIYISVITVYAFFIGCPFKRITGLNCPFCGMTRAYTAFLCGDFKSAFTYHELFYLGIPFMLGLAHLRVLKKRRGIFIAVAIFCTVCAAAFVIRLILKVLQ